MSTHNERYWASLDDPADEYDGWTPVVEDRPGLFHSWAEVRSMLLPAVLAGAVLWGLIILTVWALG